MLGEIKRYPIKNVFYTIHGEGTLAGVPSIFVRFAGCNLQCQFEKGKRSPGGFNCDTDFVPEGQNLTIAEIIGRINTLKRINNIQLKMVWIVLTGGEPGLYIDKLLLKELSKGQHYIAIETNGTIPVDDSVPGLPEVYGAYFINHITCSPKVDYPEWKINQADEWRFLVRENGSIVGLKDKSYINTEFFNQRMRHAKPINVYLSPIWNEPDLSDLRIRDNIETLPYPSLVNQKAFEYAIELVKRYPHVFKLSTQYHKFWGIS